MISYFSHLTRAINYIEKHIKEDLTLDNVAKEAGFSLYHFHRIFHSMVGFSLKEYIRKRRLSLAAHNLNTTQKSILEIALDYQFSCSETFTRAFKKEFCITPGQFRKRGVQLPLCEKLNIDDKVSNLLKGFSNLTPKIVTRKSFRIVGERRRMNLENERNISQEIEFAYDFHRRKCLSKIQDKNNSNLAIALGYEYDEIKKEYTQILGAEVTSVNTIPNNMIYYIVPPNKYAVFTVYGLKPVIQMAWNNIFEDWIFKSQFVHDPYSPHFEIYKKDWVGLEHNFVDIYIPIK